MTFTPRHLLPIAATFLVLGTSVFGQRLAESLYVPMPDGTRLAVDVYLPNDLAPDQVVPALL